MTHKLTLLTLLLALIVPNGCLENACVLLIGRALASCGLRHIGSVASSFTRCNRVAAATTKESSSHSIIISKPAGIFLLNTGMFLCLRGRGYTSAEQRKQCEKRYSFHIVLQRRAILPPPFQERQVKSC